MDCSLLLPLSGILSLKTFCPSQSLHRHPARGSFIGKVPVQNTYSFVFLGLALLFWMISLPQLRRRAHHLGYSSDGVQNHLVHRTARDAYSHSLQKPSIEFSLRSRRSSLASTHFLLDFPIPAIASGISDRQEPKNWLREDSYLSLFDA